jgi:hypothetical protein
MMMKKESDQTMLQYDHLAPAKKKAVDVLEADFSGKVGANDTKTIRSGSEGLRGGG